MMWKIDQVTFLTEKWGMIPREEIGAIVGRTANAVKKKAHRLGLRKLRLRRSRLTFPVTAVSVAALTDDSCRWPSGDRGHYTFCGASRLKGMPYCADHAKTGHVPVPPRRSPLPHFRVR